MFFLLPAQFLYSRFAYSEFVYGYVFVCMYVCISMCITEIRKSNLNMSALRDIYIGDVMYDTYVRFVPDVVY